MQQKEDPTAFTAILPNWRQYLNFRAKFSANKDWSFGEEVVPVGLPVAWEDGRSRSRSASRSTYTSCSISPRASADTMTSCRSETAACVTTSN